MTASPFDAAHRVYLDAGWAPIPLPTGAKYPPPGGVTGDRGRPPRPEQITRWLTDGYTHKVGDEYRPILPPHNIGVRLDGGVIGIDVDHYADKAGADELAALETAHGPLPPTWCSTARGDDDGPGLSRILFYRVPNGTRLKANPAPAIEIVQRHHRYAVVWPSLNPKTGTVYRWYDDTGEDADRPPYVDQLADLPWAWLEALRSVGTSGSTATAAAPEVVAAFVGTHTMSERTSMLDGIHTRLEQLPAGASRHDTLVEVACWAMREAAAGCFPAEVAITELHSWWTRVIGADHHRATGSEFSDAIAWAVGQAASDSARIKEIRERPRVDDPSSIIGDSLRSGAPPPGPIPGPQTNLEQPAAPTLRPLVDADELPSWPTHVLPTWVREHVCATAARLQVPVDLCAQLALGTLASITMGHASITVGPWSEPTNLYTYVAMHSGAGKSPAEKAIVGPLRVWERRRQEQTADTYRVELAKWKVLQQKLRKDEQGAVLGSVSHEELAHSVIAAAGDKPTPFRLTVDDATPERLVQLLAEHKTLALISTEAGLLDMVGSQTRNGGATNIDVYLKAWAGETIQRDRKGGDDGPEATFVSDALLSVVLTIQPSVITKYQGTAPELRGRGFFARFMPSVPKSLVGTRTYGEMHMPGPENDTYVNELHRLADTMYSSVGLHLTLDATAETMFFEWCDRTERQLVPGGRLAALHDAASKIRSSVLRAAAVLALAKREWQTVDAQTMADALAIGDYWIEHARFVEGVADDVDEAHAVVLALAIVDWCRRKNQLENIDPRDIYHSRRKGLKLAGVADLAPGFKHLEARGWLTFTAGSAIDIGTPRTIVRARLVADALTGFTQGAGSATESGLPRAKYADSLIGTSSSSSSFRETPPTPLAERESAYFARGIADDPPAPALDERDPFPWI